MPSPAELLATIARYDRALGQLEDAAVQRLNVALDRAYRANEKELRRLLASGDRAGLAARLSNQEQIGNLLVLVDGDRQAEISAELTDLYAQAGASGGAMADEMLRAYGVTPAAFGSPAIDAAAVQARDGVQRLIRHGEVFASRANALVEQGLLNNWGAARIARGIRNELGTLKSRAETIARTEVIRAQFESSIDRYERQGVAWVQLEAVGDDRTCPICAFRSGMAYKRTEARGIIPAHPRCRCYALPLNPSWLTEGDREWWLKHQEELHANAVGLDAGASPFEKMDGRAAPKPYRINEVVS